jgi:hypothetical protein
MYQLGVCTSFDSPPPWPYIFSDYSFLVPHPVNRDDMHLVAHAMASEKLGFLSCVLMKKNIAGVCLNIHSVLKILDIQNSSLYYKFDEYLKIKNKLVNHILP